MRHFNKRRRHITVCIKWLPRQCNATSHKPLLLHLCAAGWCIPCLLATETQLTPLAPCIRCALIEEKNNAVWCSVRYMEWVVEGKRRVSAARKLPARERIFLVNSLPPLSIFPLTKNNHMSPLFIRRGCRIISIGQCLGPFPRPGHYCPSLCVTDVENQMHETIPASPTRHYRPLQHSLCSLDGKLPHGSHRRLVQDPAYTPCLWDVSRCWRVTTDRFWSQFLPVCAGVRNVLLHKHRGCVQKAELFHVSFLFHDHE